MNEDNIENYHFISTLKTLPFIDKIILFGSRSRGDNAPRADIDLAMECPKASAKDWLTILELIDNADTLLKIDCVRFDLLPKESELRANILKEGKIIYAKN
jgi:predicted nucleotidyltransferase